MSSIEVDPNSRRARCGCWFWGCGIVVATMLIVGVVVLSWGIVGARKAARQMQCHPDPLAFALEMYYEKYSHYPPAYTVNELGEPLHSWRTLLAVEFCEDSHATIHLDEPWNSEHNRLFHDKMPTHFFDCAEADARFPYRKQNSYAHKMMIVEPRITAAELMRRGICE